MMGEVETLATLLSLKVAAVAVLGSLPIALLVATRLARGGRGTLILDALVHLPLVLPPVVVGYLLLITLGTQAPLGGWLKGSWRTNPPPVSASLLRSVCLPGSNSSRSRPCPVPASPLG